MLVIVSFFSQTLLKVFFFCHGSIIVEEILAPVKEGFTRSDIIAVKICARQQY